MQEAKELLRVSYRTLHRLVSNGTIPSVKVGRVIRIPQAALRKFTLEDGDKEAFRYGRCICALAGLQIKELKLFS
ncbi:helix-turn-helix domain-containing protein [Paenibacillus sp. OK003]|uniref:helix-turn-helix domain-containing protein n=1 Tax=Paenibacillus sp. OK003 TaxID=1884380 RepID=UPI0011139C1D